MVAWMLFEKIADITMVVRKNAFEAFVIWRIWFVGIGLCMLLATFAWMIGSKKISVLFILLAYELALCLWYDMFKHSKMRAPIQLRNQRMALIQLGLLPTGLLALYFML